MELELDFSRAGITRGHEVTGVAARLGQRDPVLISLAADGCRLGVLPEDAVPYIPESVCPDQAWSVAVLLSGNERVRPLGEGEWDGGRKRIKFRMASGRRRSFT